MALSINVHKDHGKSNHNQISTQNQGNQTLTQNQGNLANRAIVVRNCR